MLIGRLLGMVCFALVGALPGGSVAQQSRLDEMMRKAQEYSTAGKIDEAIAEGRRALAEAERVHGANHAEVARVLDRLATLYRSKNRLAEAEAAETRSRAIKQRDVARTMAAPAPGGAGRGIAPGATPPPPPRPVALPAPSAPAASPTSVPTPGATVALDPKAFAEVPVFYGTNRAAGPTQQRNGVNLVSYGTQPATTLSLGTAVVSVPRQGREKGEIPRPRAESFWRAKETEDPRFHFLLVSVTPGTREVFVRAVNDRLALSSGAYKDHAFVFVHGFNVPFEDAVFRTAQIAYDLDFTGVPFLYSWPTLEGAFGYVGARDRALASRIHLRQFLDLISQQTNAKTIHLIAHSMGTWPLLDVLREIAVTDVAQAKPPRFQEIVLAAPDMDRDNFIALAQQICPERTGARCAGGSAKGLTIYATSNDRALLASVRLAKGIDRAGLFDEARPFLVKHVDTIDVSAADTGFFSYNHSQPLERDQLLKDIGLLLQGGQRPPHQRYSIYEQRKTTEGGEYWRYQQKP